MLLTFFGDNPHKLIYLARFSKFNSGNVALFQIKVSGRDIKETILAMCFIKVTARSSFTQSKVIRQINRVH